MGSADQYDEFLKALDVSFLLRKAATVSTPVMEISEDAGTWNIKTSTTLKTMELKFKLDEQFDETTPDGREVSAKVTFEDGKIVTVQKAKKDGQKHQEHQGADRRGARLHDDHRGRRRPQVRPEIQEALSFIFWQTLEE